MSVTLAMAILLSSQGMATVDSPQEQAMEQVDVAYEELANGESEKALAKLKANTDLDKQDPAYLINLGTAYMQQGKYEKAEKAFKAAIMSNQRYDLELADGRWMDSRQAARKALSRLRHGGEFSSR